MIGGGKAYFVYRYRVDGRERETSLGPFPELSVNRVRQQQKLVALESGDVNHARF